MATSNVLWRRSGFCVMRSNCSIHSGPEETVNDSCLEVLRRRFLLFALITSGLSSALPANAKTKVKNPYDEKRLLEQNKRRQRENNAPEDFPNFIREGFDVKVKTSEGYVERDSGLIYKDFEVGKGDCPEDGQQVIFHYIGYNESGRRIDSTYMQGNPARIRMGTNALVPGMSQGISSYFGGCIHQGAFTGLNAEFDWVLFCFLVFTGFEEGIRDMKPGGKRRIIIPPELGPPVGPSTFFSSKQFEVFDVELLSIQNCKRRTIVFYSDVICE